jgi:hypothetical protein
VAFHEEAHPVLAGEHGAQRLRFGRLHSQPAPYHDPAGRT